MSGKLAIGDKRFLGQIGGMIEVGK